MASNEYTSWGGTDLEIGDRVRQPNGQEGTVGSIEPDSYIGDLPMRIDYDTGGCVWVFREDVATLERVKPLLEEVNKMNDYRTRFSVGDQVIHDGKIVFIHAIEPPRYDGNLPILVSDHDPHDFHADGSPDESYDDPTSQWLLTEEVDRLLPVQRARPSGTDSEEDDSLAAYKTRVKEVALRYGREHDMCDVLADALEELDIDPTPERRKFRVTFDVAYEGDERSVSTRVLAVWISNMMSPVDIATALNAGSIEEI